MLYTAYLICFLTGGTLLVCQLVLSLLGLGEHHDVDGHDAGADGHDAHGDHHAGPGDSTSWFVGVLTFRSLVWALTFFGLVGLATSSYLEWPLDLLAASVAGVGTLYLVGLLMRSLHQLRAEGTARIERSVGKTGTVYLKVPGQRAGAGKVTLNLQNRTVEYQAITSQQELPTGAKVVVVAVIGPDTVEVMPATDSGSLPHG